MAIVKRPSESVNRSMSLGKPVSELPDAYGKFVDCTPDCVLNFALGKRARAPGYRKRKASKHGPEPVPVEGTPAYSRRQRE
jgi:hypothetical protein